MTDRSPLLALVIIAVLLLVAAPSPRNAAGNATVGETAPSRRGSALPAPVHAVRQRAAEVANTPPAPRGTRQDLARGLATIVVGGIDGLADQFEIIADTFDSVVPDAATRQPPTSTPPTAGSAPPNAS